MIGYQGKIEHIEYYKKKNQLVLVLLGTVQPYVKKIKAALYNNAP